MAEKKEENDPGKYTGWCDIDHQDSNRKRNQAMFEKHVGSNTTEQLEMAAEQAQRFIEQVEHAMDKRSSTLVILRDLANELDSMKKDVDIAEVTGSSAAVADELTCGFASPLIAAGVTAAFPGGVTAGGAEIAEAVISKDKMKKAQEVLDEDKKAMTRVDEEYAKIRHILQSISKSSLQLGSPDQILCSLIVANKYSSSAASPASYYADAAMVTGLVLATVAFATSKITGKKTGKPVGRICLKVISRLLPKLASVITKSAVETAKSVAQSVLRGAGRIATPVMLAFDIYELVDASISINNGSKSAAARSLREVARAFERQLEDMRKLITERSSIAGDLEEMLKEDFKMLLDNIASKNDGPSDEEIAMVLQYLRMCSSENWRQTVDRLLNDVTAYVTALAFVFKYLWPNIKKPPKKEITYLTFLAHGNVQNPLLPCSLNYLNESVESITLYVPWGCGLHSSAAYGILTGSIRINNVQYTEVVMPRGPFDWNTLPRDDTLIPEVVFNQVTRSENVYDSLMSLFHLLEGNTRGLVIPYFQLPGMPNLPEIPLWALANVVGVLGWLLDVPFSIHIAACMISNGQSIETCRLYPPVRTVNCEQYRVVPVQPQNPVYMFIPQFSVPQYLISEFGVLDTLLGTDN